MQFNINQIDLKRDKMGLLYDSKGKASTTKSHTNVLKKLHVSITTPKKLDKTLNLAYCAVYIFISFRMVTIEVTSDIGLPNM